MLTVIAFVVCSTAGTVVEFAFGCTEGPAVGFSVCCPVEAVNSSTVEVVNSGVVVGLVGQGESSSVSIGRAWSRLSRIARICAAISGS